MSVTEVKVPDHFPHLAKLLRHGEAERRRDEFERLGIAPLWQAERDLALLERYAPAEDVARAYGDLVRNAGHFVEGLYEIHVAAMMAPFVESIELAPRIERGRCDLKYAVGGQTVFVEVSTWIDKFPPPDGKLHARATVEKSFDPASKRDHPEVRGIPASKELRDRVADELRQLPIGEATVVVIGAPNSWSEDVAGALFGDEYIVATSKQMWQERAPNGLFSVADDVGGASRLSAVVWLKLAARFSDVQVRGRLFVNRRAAKPLFKDTEEHLRRIFDRGAVLRRELERIKKVLVEEYQAERIILFGSLAEEESSNVDRVHQWSDIDLAIVKNTRRPFTERAGEILDLVEPRVSVNVLVYTPEEFEQAQLGKGFFVREEIVKRGVVLFP